MFFIFPSPLKYDFADDPQKSQFSCAVVATPKEDVDGHGHVHFFADLDVYLEVAVKALFVGIEICFCGHNTGFNIKIVAKVRGYDVGSEVFEMVAEGDKAAISEVEGSF